MRQKVSTAALVVFLAAAGLCSALALANAPVGPSTYTPALASMRPLVENDSTLILASPELLEDDHGTNYLAWELRGGRVCIATRAEVGGNFPDRGPLRDRPGLPPQGSVRRSAAPQGVLALRPLGSERPGREAERLPADRGPPGPPRPRALTPRILRSVEAATDKIVVTLPDGTPLELPAGATGADAAMAIGPGLAKAALAIKVDGDAQGPRRAAARGRGGGRDRHRARPRGRSS